MINQFLKVGGVATLKDFYQKFPTQAHFDHFVEMKYGGINAYANGGSLRSYQGDVGGSTVTGFPNRADYMDNEEQWQEDVESYYRSLPTPQPRVSPLGSDGMSQYFRKPAEASAAPVAAMQIPSKVNPYGGVSIVDFLGAQNKATDIASRKKLAEAMGVSGYTGKASENTKLLKMLQSSPELLDSYPSGSTSGSGGGKKKLSKSANNYAKSVGKTIGVTGRPIMDNDDDDGPSIWPYVGIGAGAGLGYAGYKMLGKKGAAAMQKLKQLGYSAPEAMKLLGYNGGLPPGGSPMKQIGTGVRMIGNQGGGAEIAKNIAQRGAYTVEELRSLMQVDPAAAQKIASQFPKAAKGTVKAVAASTPAAVKAASNVSTTASNIKKAAAAPISGWKESVNAFKEAPFAKNAAKLYKYFSKIRRLEQGGETDDLDMLHHYYKLNYLQNGGYMDYNNAYMNDGEGSYAYGGQPNFNYYQEGGEENEDPSLFGIQMPGWLKTGIQVLDPTGVSGYEDAGRSIKNAWNNPGWGSIGNALIDTFSALPIVGKAGKLVKAVGAGVDAAKVAKPSIISKVTKPITKAYKAVSNVKIIPDKVPIIGGFKPFKAIEQLDNKTGIHNLTGYPFGQLLGKAPKVVQKAVPLTNDMNRFRRWGEGFEQGVLGGIGINPETNNSNARKTYGGVQYSHGGYYGNVPQHGNPGVYADGYSGTSSGGQYFQEGGAFVPTYGDSAYGLPQYNWGANYQEGGMAPQEMAPEQPSEGGGMDPQQVMQEVAQMLQQGAQPEQIMQELVQQGIPEEVAQQIIQQVMQQMQGGGAEQQAPPQQRYGGGYAKGGISAGQEMDVSPEQMEALRQQGYKFDII